jgi:hypothetical protein
MLRNFKTDLYLCFGSLRQRAGPGPVPCKTSLQVVLAEKSYVRFHLNILCLLIYLVNGKKLGKVCLNELTSSFKNKLEGTWIKLLQGRIYKCWKN